MGGHCRGLSPCWILKLLKRNQSTTKEQVDFKMFISQNSCKGLWKTHVILHVGNLFWFFFHDIFCRSTWYHVWKAILYGKVRVKPHSFYDKYYILISCSMYTLDSTLNVQNCTTTARLTNCTSLTNGQKKYCESTFWDQWIVLCLGSDSTLIPYGNGLLKSYRTLKCFLVKYIVIVSKEKSPKHVFSIYS